MPGPLPAWLRVNTPRLLRATLIRVGALVWLL
jgi:hypothetical protein